jgi:hypothetical protein
MQADRPCQQAKPREFMPGSHPHLLICRGFQRACLSLRYHEVQSNLTLSKKRLPKLKKLDQILECLSTRTSQQPSRPRPQTPPTLNSLLKTADHFVQTLLLKILAI